MELSSRPRKKGDLLKHRDASPAGLFPERGNRFHGRGVVFQKPQVDFWKGPAGVVQKRSTSENSTARPRFGSRCSGGQSFLAVCSFPAVVLVRIYGLYWVEARFDSLRPPPPGGVTSRLEES